MTQIDSNVWYMLTETRVDFNSSFQYNGNGLFFAARVQTSDSGQLWQFLSIPDGQWQIRNIGSAINQQLATCYVASEVSDSKTQPCMQPSSNNPSQKWIIDSWGDGTYKFMNVGNGSGYNMDVHPGNPPFMSDQIATTPNQPAQHWEFSSIRDVNDGAYSTTFVSIGCLSSM
jgi:Ricin-type beta-trefoil lectin domain-like